MKAKSGFTVIVSAAILTGTAITGLAIDRMKSVVECKDARLYMDGSFRVFVQVGGLNHRTELKVLRRNGLNWDYMGSSVVSAESTKVAGIQTDTYANPNLKMVVTGKMRPPLKGFPAQINGELAGEDVTAPLGCIPIN